MKDNQLLPYLPVLMQLLIAAGIGTGMIVLSAILGQRKYSRVKMQAYECGITPTGDAQHRFSVKFYLVAMLFILFDIEVVFLYPWAVVYKEMLQEHAAAILGSMISFLVILFAGYVYALKKRAFDWKG